MKPSTPFFLSILCILVLGSCQNNSEDSNRNISTVSQEANIFFDEYFDLTVDRSPQYQGYQGIKKDNDKWDDISDEYAQEGLAIKKEKLKYLIDSIKPASLDKQTLVSYKLFKQKLENEIADFKWRFHTYPINQMRGLHSSIPAYLINTHQVADSSDAAAYISRLNAIPPLFDQLIENLKVREEKGIVAPKFVFPRVIEDSRNLLKGAPFDDGEASTLFADFQSKVGKLEISDNAKSDLIAASEVALIEKVSPAYKKLIAFLQELEQRASTDDGAWKFPEGEAYYETKLKRTTTTDLTNEDIHQIGLSEVDRIHKEIKSIMKKVEFDGSLAEFFTFLKEDDQFYYPDTDEGKIAYIDSATAIIDNMRDQLDDLFITKPKASMIVKRVEAFREKSTSKAFYQRPAPDGSRPGTYYANLGSTRNMPKFEMEALAYHEGIPGHHMDRTIAMELEGIPKFRKFGSYTACVEGWGLYSEFIPKELGMYSNPYSDYGRLAMELWRACRLVVDTGIHFKKWTREEAIDYYLTNTSGTEKECVRMVERHIVLPSQATAYKIGMMKILELRSTAKEKLGDKFDIREFHEVILTSGAIPLQLMEEMVMEWVASKEA
ncbi:MAG: DUF885 domain-containing protein [Cyclobacteriaceae bacterium]